ncbi:hypothetical protein Dimus_001211 [Dionaea muscipula]
MREKKFMRPGNVGNIAKQLAMKKRVQMSVLQPSQQPLAHEGQEAIKKSSSAKKLFMEEVIQERQRQDNGKQVVEKEKEQEDQTPNAMQTVDIDDQVLGSSAMHSDADGGKKRKRMSEADIDDQVRMKNRIDFVEFLGTLSRTSNLCPLIVDKWIDMNKVYKDAKKKMWDYVKVKRDHYTPYETTKMRWKNRLEDVPDEDFKFLLKKWKDPKTKQTNLHTCGPKSFAVIRERLVKKQLKMIFLQMGFEEMPTSNYVESRLQ